MGYYTSYELSVSNVNPLLASKLEEEVEKMQVFESGNSKDGWYGYDKWYDHDEDMMLLSKRFPDALFELYGDGEESDDMWRAYFKNGRMQFCPAIITFDPFDEKKLTESDKIMDWDRKYSYQSA